jgi:DNA-binding response OmpR family regulator
MNKKLKALVVDDDELSQNFLQFFLAKQFDVSTVGNVESFNNIISNVDFDMIFMDVSLRDTKNGIQLVSELRSTSKYKNIPILILTNLDSVLIRDRALKAGADKFINKPILIEQLAKIVDAVLSK